MNVGPRHNAVCRAITASGDRCPNPAAYGRDYCYEHLQGQILERAALRAIVLSVVFLVLIIASRYFLPELESIVSCAAIVAATLSGIAIAAIKMQKSG